MWITGPVTGQDIHFSNLNTSNGLSDNFIRSVAVDKNGFLWIGTNEGLNMYDGYAVTLFSQDEHPEIPSKTITHIYCDSRNNVWLGSALGVARVDEKRKFHSISIADSIPQYSCWFIAETKKYGPLLITSKGQFYPDPAYKHWNRVDWIPEYLATKRITDVINYDENKLLISTDSLVTILDYAAGKVVYAQPFSGIISVCPSGPGRIVLANTSGSLTFVDIRNGNIVRETDLSSYVTPRIPKTFWAEVRPAAGGNIVYASNRLGFFIVGPDGNVKHYAHEPTNPSSVAGDRVVRVLGQPDGTVIVGTERYGLSMFNILKKEAVYQKFFADKNGNYFDGYLTEMAQDKDGTYWIGSVDRLIHWDKKTNSSVFYQYEKYDTALGLRNPDIFRICIDRLSQIWVSIPGSGVAQFDRRSGTFNLLKRDTTISPSLKSNFVFDLYETSDGKIWVGSTAGFYTIDTRSKKIETFNRDSLLGPIATTRVDGFAEDRKGRLWISTSGKGIYCYDKKNRTIRHFGKSDGLLDDICLDLMVDSRDALYVTMYKGFNIISPEGKISTYSRANGLRFDKADAFLEDNEGKIWVSNAKCLLRFDPATGKMDFYDEHENLNNGGFKPSSSLKAPDGELLWGTQSGINYFYPDQLKNLSEPLRVSIYRVLAGDSSLSLPDQQIAHIRYRNNNLQFYFVAINLCGSRNIRYQYRLDGYDNNWQEGTDIRQARYSSLPPGKYRFRVRASGDRKNWVDAPDAVQFSIIAPLYMRGWFKLGIALLAAGVLFYYTRRRSLQLKQKKEELETEQAINYFATSLYDYQTVDDILWDVARNCIGRLQFEDCVIYLLDEKRNVLVQKAAHGPKSPRNFEITQPIDIPLGRGIVGSAALSRKTELIPDTTKDPRYIVDDEARLSEIAVPIVSGNRLLGVIDCEHSKKRFFTQRHVSILTTIASLCANKIVRARTEAEKKQAESMLTETKQKMAEAEMQALRAQMNPHFIFNCLNSINRYIVKSDQATASLYLTRFAKLIRLILDNSNSKDIVLTNELEALRLYIEMESLRFDNKFTYSIDVAPNVSTDSIEVPPLIIQPYIENAIWHGLLHKTEGGHLAIHISLPSPGMLQCVIEDNGVGREKAAELKSKSATTKKSLGMELTENRLLLLNKYASVHSSVEIVDLKDERQFPRGTRVILNIPIGE